MSNVYPPPHQPTISDYFGFDPDCDEAALGDIYDPAVTSELRGMGAVLDRIPQDQRTQLDSLASMRPVRQHKKLSRKKKKAARREKQ